VPGTGLQSSGLPLPSRFESFSCCSPSRWPWVVIARGPRSIARVKSTYHGGEKVRAPEIRRRARHSEEAGGCGWRGCPPLQIRQTCGPTGSLRRGNPLSTLSVRESGGTVRESGGTGRRAGFRKRRARCPKSLENPMNTGSLLVFSELCFVVIVRLNHARVVESRHKSRHSRGNGIATARFSGHGKELTWLARRQNRLRLTNALESRSAPGFGEPIPLPVGRWNCGPFRLASRQPAEARLHERAFS
jgi:hypothetical protein